MATSLYKDNTHQCLIFTNLVEGRGVQSNQFMIVDNGQSLLLDPGGQLTYHPLLTSILRYTEMEDLKYVIASHQDPDVIASLAMWLKFSNAKVLCSKLWVRFLPHLASNKVMQMEQENHLSHRVIGIPDAGATLKLGDSRILLVPAHFLHSVGNFHFYDCTSKILFSGDMGASIVEDDNCQPVEDFNAHIPLMEAFHKRYMVSNKVCRLWVNMVRQLDLEMIVPQHGQPFVGNPVIDQFLDWIEDLECGADLATQKNFQLPK